MASGDGNGTEREPQSSILFYRSQLFFSSIEYRIYTYTRYIVISDIRITILYTLYMFSISVDVVVFRF